MGGRTLVSDVEVPCTPGVPLIKRVDEPPNGAPVTGVRSDEFVWMTGKIEPDLPAENDLSALFETLRILRSETAGNRLVRSNSVRSNRLGEAMN